MSALVPEWRVGRNFIRPGDVVRILPSSPKRKDGGYARVVALIAEAEGEPPTTVHVLKEGAHRFYVADRVQRLAQTKAGRRREFAR